MKAKIHYSDTNHTTLITFYDGKNSGFVISGYHMVNMVEVRNIIMAKDRATECLLWLTDERVGKLSNYLINLPDGTEIEDEITVELRIGSTHKTSHYKIVIDENNDFVTFQKNGEDKEYKVKKDSCECMAWRFCKGTPKRCKHTDMLSLMGIQLKKEPKKIVLTKEERKDWNKIFRKEKIKDKEAKDFILRYNQQLILDYNAMTVAEWYDIYNKVKSGNINFIPSEEI